MEQIPEVPFRQKTGFYLDFEILTLQNLFKRQARLPHRLDQPHRLNFFAILLITQGVGSHFIDFQAYPYEPGTTIFTAQGQVHAFEIKPENEGFQILFTEAFLQKLGIPAETFSFYRVYNDNLYSPVIQPQEMEGEDFLNIMLALQQESQRADDGVKAEILACWLKLLLLKAERIKAATAPTITNPARYHTFALFKHALETHPITTRNAQDYAALLHISYKHLNRLCKEFTALTAKQCIDRWLILEIKRQLASSTLSIKEITHQVGFDEPTNLVKFFKQRTGQTPAQFRQAFA
jgi:AraC family transcriptional regulator, transcriptional activator of pobA